jgi:hypothetical protein
LVQKTLAPGVKFPLQPQSTAGHSVRTLNCKLSYGIPPLVKVAVNPDMPATGIAVPEGTDVPEAPRVDQSMIPSTCSPAARLTAWIVCGWASGFEADSATEAPPDGAGACNVTVPTEEAPPVTLAGAKVNDARVFVVLGAKKTSRK